MSKEVVKYHALTESSFYKVPGPNVLAKILNVSVDKLEKIANEQNPYREWYQKKDCGGLRHIEAPNYDLKRIQKRIADLLSRVTPPEYLTNPVKGRSYLDNAAPHIYSKEFHLLDIADFYPSCTSKRVAQFFKEKMCCAGDVAAILVKLTTRNDHLPQGSPCSSYLAFYAYIDMWQKVEAIINSADYILSVYADDITISGDKVSGETVFKIKSLFRKYGFKLKDEKEIRIINKPADITGVIVKGHELLLPNRQHKKLHSLKKERVNAMENDNKESLDRKIAGRLAQKKQIENYSNSANSG